MDFPRFRKPNIQVVVGKSERIYVLHCAGPHAIYVWKMNDYHKYAQFHCAIQQAYLGGGGASSSPRNIKTGAIREGMASVVEADNGVFYRATILGHVPSGVSVKIVDLGRSMVLRYDQVFECTLPKLLIEPTQAVACCIDGFDKSPQQHFSIISDDIVKRLTERVEGRVFMADIVGTRGSEKTIVVRLFGVAETTVTFETSELYADADFLDDMNEKLLTDTPTATFGSGRRRRRRGEGAEVDESEEAKSGGQPPSGGGRGRIYEVGKGFGRGGRREEPQRDAFGGRRDEVGQRSHDEGAGRGRRDQTDELFVPKPVQRDAFGPREEVGQRSHDVGRERRNEVGQRSHDEAFGRVRREEAEGVFGAKTIEKQRDGFGRRDQRSHEGRRDEREGGGFGPKQREGFGRRDEGEVGGFVPKQREGFGRRDEGEVGGFVPKQREGFGRRDEGEVGGFVPKQREGFGRRDEGEGGFVPKQREGFGRRDEGEVGFVPKQREGFGRRDEGDGGGFVPKPVPKDGFGRRDDGDRRSHEGRRYEAELGFRPKRGGFDRRDQRSQEGRRDEGEGGFGPMQRGGFGRRDESEGGFGPNQRGGFGRNYDGGRRSQEGRRDEPEGEGFVPQHRGGFGRRDEDEAGFGPMQRGGFGRRYPRSQEGRRDEGGFGPQQRGGFGRREEGEGPQQRGGFGRRDHRPQDGRMDEVEGTGFWPKQRGGFGRRDEGPHNDGRFGHGLAEDGGWDHPKGWATEPRRGGADRFRDEAQPNASQRPGGWGGDEVGRRYERRDDGRRSGEKGFGYETVGVDYRRPRGDDRGGHYGGGELRRRNEWSEEGRGGFRGRGGGRRDFGRGSYGDQMPRGGSRGGGGRGSFEPQTRSGGYGERREDDVGFVAAERDKSPPKDDDEQSVPSPSPPPQVKEMPVVEEELNAAEIRSFDEGTEFKVSEIAKNKIGIVYGDESSAFCVPRKLAAAVAHDCHREAFVRSVANKVYKGSLVDGLLDCEELEADLIAAKIFIAYKSRVLAPMRVPDQENESGKMVAITTASRFYVKLKADEELFTRLKYLIEAQKPRRDFYELEDLVGVTCLLYLENEEGNSVQRCIVQEKSDEADGMFVVFCVDDGYFEFDVSLQSLGRITCDAIWAIPRLAYRTSFSKVPEMTDDELLEWAHENEGRHLKEILFLNPFPPHLIDVGEDMFGGKPTKPVTNLVTSVFPGDWTAFWPQCGGNSYYLSLYPTHYFSGEDQDESCDDEGLCLILVGEIWFRAKKEATGGYSCVDLGGRVVQEPERVVKIPETDNSIPLMSMSTELAGGESFKYPIVATVRIQSYSPLNVSFCEWIDDASFVKTVEKDGVVCNYGGTDSFDAIVLEQKLCFDERAYDLMAKVLLSSENFELPCRERTVALLEKIALEDGESEKAVNAMSDLILLVLFQVGKLDEGNKVRICVDENGRALRVEETTENLMDVSDEKRKDDWKVFEVTSPILKFMPALKKCRGEETTNVADVSAQSENSAKDESLNGLTDSEEEESKEKSNGSDADEECDFCGFAESAKLNAEEFRKEELDGSNEEEEKKETEDEGFKEEGESKEVEEEEEEECLQCKAEAAPLHELEERKNRVNSDSDDDDTGDIMVAIERVQQTMTGSDESRRGSSFDN